MPEVSLFSQVNAKNVILDLFQMLLEDNVLKVHPLSVCIHMLERDQFKKKLKLLLRNQPVQQVQSSLVEVLVLSLSLQVQLSTR